MALALVTFTISHNSKHAKERMVLNKPHKETYFFEEFVQGEATPLEVPKGIMGNTRMSFPATYKAPYYFIDVRLPSHAQQYVADEIPFTLRISNVHQRSFRPKGSDYLEITISSHEVSSKNLTLALDSTEAGLISIEFKHPGEHTLKIEGRVIYRNANGWAVTKGIPFELLGEPKITVLPKIDITRKFSY